MNPRRAPGIFDSFNFAFEGIIHVLRTQRNLRIHFVVAVAVLVAVWLGVLVGVLVGVFVLVTVFEGVLVGVFVGVMVAVLLGVLPSRRLYIPHIRYIGRCLMLGRACVHRFRFD